MEIIHQDVVFNGGGERLVGTVTSPVGYEGRPTVLFLHGAGPGNRQRYQQTAEYVAGLGLASFRFDHAGHGDSSGNLLGSTLNGRVDEAKAALAFCSDTEPLSLLGSSMGGYVAVRLLEYARVAKLGVIVPAAYTRKAEDMPFGEDFSRALREPFSWQDSRLWDILPLFRGDFLLVHAGQDPVIPPDVVRRYWDAASSARRRLQFFHPDAPHALTPWLEKEGQLDSYRLMLRDFLLGKV